MNLHLGVFPFFHLVWFSDFHNVLRALNFVVWEYFLGRSVLSLSLFGPKTVSGAWEKLVEGREPWPSMVFEHVVGFALWAGHVPLGVIWRCLLWSLQLINGCTLLFSQRRVALLSWVHLPSTHMGLTDSLDSRLCPPSPAAKALYKASVVSWWIQFPYRGHFCPPGIFAGSLWRHFWLSQLSRRELCY